MVFSGSDLCQPEAPACSHQSSAQYHALLLSIGSLNFFPMLSKYQLIFARTRFETQDESCSLSESRLTSSPPRMTLFLQFIVGCTVYQSINKSATVE